jgi:indole-3-glycerol phosphate synthase
VVDTRRTFELLPRIPTGTIVVAESGFRTPAELDELEAAGIDAVLVGEALMRAGDIEAAARALTARGVRTP